MMTGNVEMALSVNTGADESLEYCLKVSQTDVLGSCNLHG